LKAGTGSEDLMIFILKLFEIGKEIGFTQEIIIVVPIIRVTAHNSRHSPKMAFSEIWGESKGINSVAQS